MAASCRVAVMEPVLCATGVPAGTPAGISSLNSCRSRISFMRVPEAGLTASLRSMPSRRIARSADVVVLLRPAA